MQMNNVKYISNADGRVVVVKTSQNVGRLYSNQSRYATVRLSIKYPFVAEANEVMLRRGFVRKNR